MSLPDRDYQRAAARFHEAVCDLGVCISVCVDLKDCLCMDLCV